MTRATASSRRTMGARTSSSTTAQSRAGVQEPRGGREGRVRGGGRTEGSPGAQRQRHRFRLISHMRARLCLTDRPVCTLLWDRVCAIRRKPHYAGTRDPDDQRSADALIAARRICARQVRRGSTVRVRHRASRSPCRSALSVCSRGNGSRPRRPPSVHGPSGSPSARAGNAGRMLLQTRSGRRPPSVHGPLERVETAC
jgi:hypothetical protein